jgi:hypothetical protein
MKKTKLTVDRAINKLKKQATLAIKNNNYTNATQTVNGLQVLSDLNKHHQTNQKLREKQSPSFEIEYALVQAFKWTRTPLTFKQIQAKMQFSPNSADKTYYNGTKTPRWVQRANARLRGYLLKGYATFDKTNRTWALTQAGKKALKKDGYF